MLRAHRALTSTVARVCRFPAAAMSTVPAKLGAGEITSKMPTIPEWTHTTDGRDAIARKFLFKDFSEALGFMVETGVACDKMDHHPEWFNVYNRVEVVFSTHDCGGLSERDFSAAKLFDAAFSKRQQ